MDKEQFQYLIAQLECMQKSIVDKLEEIRCGIIDIENEIEKVKSSVSPASD